MKYVLTILIFASCATSVLPTSERVKDEIKQADQIILITDFRDIELLNKVERHLIKNGFVIENKNIENLEISTKPKIYTGGIGLDNLIINVEIEENEVIFIGSTGTEFFGFKIVDNSKGELKRGWDRLKTISLDLPHREFYFKRN